MIASAGHHVPRPLEQNVLCTVCRESCQAPSAVCARPRQGPRSWDQGQIVHRRVHGLQFQREHFRAAALEFAQGAAPPLKAETARRSVRRAPVGPARMSQGHVVLGSEGLESFGGDQAPENAPVFFLCTARPGAKMVPPIYPRPSAAAFFTCSDGRGPCRTSPAAFPRHGT
jgi:hypothetical protein